MKVLLLDTSFSSAPIYNSLLDQGCDVYVCGNNPDDYLARSVNQYHRLDYSCAEKVASLLSSDAFDVVVPGCNDVSYSVCAELKGMGFQSFVDDKEVVDALFSKDNYRDLLTSLNVPTPKVIEALTETESESVCFPVIVKPTDSYSGLGISVVDQPSDLDLAIDQAKKYSKNDTVVIEQFVTGQLCSHSAFVKGGEILWDVFVDEYCFFNPYAVDISFVNLRISDAIQVTLRESVRKIVSHLGLVDGLLHTQFIYKNDECWLIEATRRCPGDLYSRLIEHTLGVNYAGHYAAFLIGQHNEASLDILNMRHDPVIRSTLNVAEGKVAGAIYPPEDLRLIELISLVPLGARDPNRSRVGVAFFVCDKERNIRSKAESLEFYRQVSNNL